MIIRSSRSKPVASAAILLFFILIFNTTYLNSGKVVSQEAESVFKQGQDAYKEGDFVKAIERFSQVLVLSKDKGLLTDTYFYLSLCNFHMNEITSAKEWIRRVVEADPGRRISSIYPVEYRELYEEVKREVSVSMETRTSPPREDTTTKDEKKGGETPQVVVVPAESRGGGGGSVILYVLLGAALAGGAAYFLLKEKNKDEGNGGNGGNGEEQKGSIQVNSTPTGAKVYLDGVNTGKTTNTTLTDVNPGSHTIKLTKDAYVDHSTSVTVSAGQTTTINASLKKHTLTLTDPEGDTVWYRGQKADIKWTTGDSSSSGDFFGMMGRFSSLFKGGNPMAHLKRMRMFRFNAQTQRRTSQESSLRKEGGVRSQAFNAEESLGLHNTQGEIIGFHTINQKVSTPVSGTPTRSTIQPFLQNTNAGNSMEKGSLSEGGIQGLEKVKIELLQAGKVINTIASSTNNDGSYSWEVPLGLDDAANYKVKIQSVSESSVNDVSEKFEITSAGDVRIKSTPNQAIVYLDGKDTGKKTNCILTDISTGTHTIMLIKEGYVNYVKSIQVKANQVKVVDADLTKHAITVNSPAAGDEWARGSQVNILWNSDAASEVLKKLDESEPIIGTGIDSQERDGISGETKAQVLSNVKIDLYHGGNKVNTIAANTENDGSHSWTVPKNTTLGSNYKVRISCVSDPRVFGESGLFSVTGFGSIKVTSSPSDADVFLDGSDTGENTPCLLKNITPGNHTIKITKTGFADYEKTVMVKEDKTTNISATLAKLQIKITKPEKYDIWGKGKTVKINWKNQSTTSLRRSSSAQMDMDKSNSDVDDPSTDTASNKVKIELYKGLAKAATLTNSTANDGEYEWKVSKERDIAGENFTIKISVVGQSEISDESEIFTITDMNYEYTLTIGSGPGSGNTQFNHPYAIALDKSVPTHLYIADCNNHRIVKYTWTGSFVKIWGSYGSGWNQLKSPTGIAVDYWGDQKVYVADYYNHRISIWTDDGVHVTNWGSGPGNGTNQFNGPGEVAISKDNKLYVTDNGNNRAKKTGLSGWVYNIWGSFGTGAGQFKSPYGIHIDNLGNLYISEINNDRIQKFDANGNYKLMWGNTGTEDGQFNNPRGVATDIFGFVYVVDHNNCRIQKFTSLGKFIVTWGSQGSAINQFEKPRGIAVDGYGNVYVADTENNRIQKFRVKYD